MTVDAYSPVEAEETIISRSPIVIPFLPFEFRFLINNREDAANVTESIGSGVRVFESCACDMVMTSNEKPVRPGVYFRSIGFDFLPGFLLLAFGHFWCGWGCGCGCG